MALRDSAIENYVYFDQIIPWAMNMVAISAIEISFGSRAVRQFDIIHWSLFDCRIVAILALIQRRSLLVIRSFAVSELQLRTTFWVSLLPRSPDQLWSKNILGNLPFRV